MPLHFAALDVAQLKEQFHHHGLNSIQSWYYCCYRCCCCYLVCCFLLLPSLRKISNIRGLPSYRIVLPVYTFLHRCYPFLLPPCSPCPFWLPWKYLWPVRYRGIGPLSLICIDTLTSGNCVRSMAGDTTAGTAYTRREGAVGGSVSVRSMAGATAAGAASTRGVGGSALLAFFRLIVFGSPFGMISACTSFKLLFLSLHNSGGQSSKVIQPVPLYHHPQLAISVGVVDAI